MKRWKFPQRAALVLLTLLPLVGCEHLLQPPPVADQAVKEPAPRLPPLPPPPSPVDTLAALLDQLGGASPGELAREYERLALIPEPSRGPDALLRLALLLSQPGLPFRDDAAAARVLQEWETRQVEADPAIKGFVRWLRGQLGERNRLTSGLDETILRAREEKKRADVCKDKLEALKNMEKSLIERDKH